MVSLFSCSDEAETDKFESPGKTALDNDTTKLIDIIEVTADNQLTEKKCGCYNGIGSSEKDNPIMTFEFSNKKSVSICGYSNKENKIISEFNIFDCKTGNSYVEFGALESCQIKAYNDSLEIQLLKFLPVGNNWEWQNVQVGKQIITTKVNELEVSKIIGTYKPNKIDINLQERFLNSLHKGHVSTEDWENTIGKLEVLSLNGNERAWQILIEFEDYTGQETDGALADDWKDAIATVRWLIGKNN